MSLFQEEGLRVHCGRQWQYRWDGRSHSETSLPHRTTQNSTLFCLRIVCNRVLLQRLLRRPRRRNGIGMLSYVSQLKLSCVRLAAKAIRDGVQLAKGKFIVLMDTDMSYNVIVSNTLPPLIALVFSLKK